MELKYIVMTIIKILISVPCVILLHNPKVEAAALMGGHLDNNNNSSTPIEEATNTSLWEKPPPKKQSKLNDAQSEEIPDPSALVLPGYNLPENIFNKGKPFYLEKDPLTGRIDFNSKTSLADVDDDFDVEYVDEEPSPDLYEKANIDRKDGSLSGHKATDVNQLTPNFHDFLNLPVKYNPDKYVYPLISSSYANTKVQGNINKYHNHKVFAVTTYKPPASTSYFTLKTPHFRPGEEKRTTTTTTPRSRPTTTQTTTTTTTKEPNLLDSALNFPNFAFFTTEKPKIEEIYITTKSVDEIYLTTQKNILPTTTKRPLSLFEQLFGEYEEVPPTTQTTSKPPSLFQNLPSIKNEKKPEETTKVGQEMPNVLIGSEMGHESAYEYDDSYDYYSDLQNNTFDNPKNNQIESRPITTTTLRTSISTTTSSPATTRTTTTSTTTKRPSTTTKNPSTTAKITTTASPTPTKSRGSTTTPKNMAFNILVPDYDVEPMKPQNVSKVTSLPLGENHFGPPPSPIIAVTHHLKEQLNSEKVPLKPFPHAPVVSSSNIRIPSDQDTISFVVGNNHNVGGDFVGASFKEGPFDSNPFRPLIMESDDDKDKVSFTIQAKPVFSQSFVEKQALPSAPQPLPQRPRPLKPQPSEMGGSSINIQPIKTSEASLSIGVPINGMKKVPGQVVDEYLDTENIEYPKKGTGAKIIFPDDRKEKPSTITPDLKPPPPHPNREVLKLSSKPVYHQLPSDLTPPNEQDPKFEKPRPPWDPRPGHFYNGRPEYSRPPRPPLKSNPDVFKRIDNLPNILPQFRPNSNAPHYFDHPMKVNGYMRQPLLERPSNRPIGFFEKLIPPPPPPQPSKNLLNLRKVPILEQELRTKHLMEENKKPYEFHQPPTPPPLILSNRRSGDEATVETLQMIQAKQMEKTEQSKIGGPSTSIFKTNLQGKDSTEKPLYVVYPVNSAPIKLDALDSHKKETVVVGTRAELPLPPSKINQEFTYESPQDRKEAPILKPQNKPSNFPIKSDFPYPLERPEVSSGNPSDDSRFSANNQWDAVRDTEARIVTGTKINYKNPNQISVTLKSFTEKPIAVAYTPTEPYKKLENTEKYSMPNYASPVISEIRPSSGLIDRKDSEITVSAIMHTHPQMEVPKPILGNKHNYLDNHKIESEEKVHEKLGFQAPFQASMNVDGLSQGWTVVKNDEKPKIDRIDRIDRVDEATTMPVATTSEFDIENFKPQLFGGFKPIYSYPDSSEKSAEAKETTKSDS